MQPIATIPLKGRFKVFTNIATGGTKGTSPHPLWTICRTDDRINFKCSSGSAVTHKNIPGKTPEALGWAPILKRGFNQGDVYDT